MAATSRDDDPVHLYLTEIGAHPLLSRDDEVRLAKTTAAGVAAADELAGGDPSPARRRTLRRRVHEGELAARRLTEANLRLVVSIAKRCQHSGVALLALIQEGNLGLLHAVKKFDHTKGFKFSTYATWWIRQAISRGITAQARTVRLPAAAEDFLRRVGRVEAHLEAQRHRRPSVDEVADAVGAPTSKVTEVMRFATSPMSLSTPLDDDGAELADVVADDGEVFTELEDTFLSEDLAELCCRLDERQRDVLTMRYGLDGRGRRTHAHIGALLGISAQGVRQIERRTLERLRRIAAPSGLGEHLVDA